MSKMMGMQDPNYPDIVTLADGTRMNRDKAIRTGHSIHTEVPASVEAGELDKIKRDHGRWRSAIMLLPEARERPSAVAEMLSTQTANTLSVMAARAFLRGLPTEQPEEAPTMTNHQYDPRAARRAELQGSMAAFNRERGYRTEERPGASTAARAAALGADVDPVRLRRMAEIRLNLLNPTSREAKTLANVLESHAMTGASLPSLLSQANLDISKILPRK